MSGHLRYGFAAFLVAVFSTPAASNPITDLLSPNPAPEATEAAPAPAPEACLRQPGPASAGGHWVYRYDGHRKCWFEAAEEGAVAKKPARHHVARHSVAAPGENEAAPRRQKAVEDAHAELVKSAPAQTPQPAPSEPTLKVVHTVPVWMTDAAGMVPPAPVRAEPGADQSTPDKPNSDQSGPRQLNVETLLAKAPTASEEVASAPPAIPIVVPTATTGGGEEGIASWLGVLLIALGGAALLSSSRTLRRALWPVRFPDSRTELPVIAHDDRDARLRVGAHLFRQRQARRAFGIRPPEHGGVGTHHPRPPAFGPRVAFSERLLRRSIGATAAQTIPVSPEVFFVRPSGREIEPERSRSNFGLT